MALNELNVHDKALSGWSLQRITQVELNSDTDQFMW